MSAKKKTKKGFGFKKFIFSFGIIAFGIYAAYSFVTYQYDLAQKQRELEEIQQKCEETRLANAEMERLLDQKDSTDYLEKLAREKLGYGYKDEVFYIDISGN